MAPWFLLRWGNSTSSPDSVNELVVVPADRSRAAAECGTPHPHDEAQFKRRYAEVNGRTYRDKLYWPSEVGIAPRRCDIEIH
jgi:hypothetical protein